jgi:uncharacterized protein YkwD
MPTGDFNGAGYVSPDQDSIAKAQVNSWIKSPGHHENMLQKDLTILGAGVAYNGKYYFCTQDFYQPEHQYSTRQQKSHI